jgi:NAD(P)-dependent dehydrogenase (short-subunit alcohol dehydrogenase family)
MFNLKDKVIVITGGTGLLGRQHADAVASHGAIPVLLDINQERLDTVSADITKRHGVKCAGLKTDITSESAVAEVCARVIQSFGKVDVLINNAANNPQVDSKGKVGGEGSRLENFSLAAWSGDIAVGLTGAFLCAKHFGAEIAKNPGGGAIINIASDLGLIGPDQRLYRKEGLPESEQPVKPVTYSVVKSGLVGLTRYIATYWAEKNVRCNALCPGGVQTNQPEAFVKELTSRIPMARMARQNEYQGVIVFLCSDEASYMNGSIISMDGGRTAW